MGAENLQTYTIMLIFGIIAAILMILGAATFAGFLFYAVVKLSECESFDLDDTDYKEDPHHE